jgi:hypothetical protein
VHLNTTLDVEDWDKCSRPLGLGPVVEVDTMRPVDVGYTAGLVRAHLNTDPATPQRAD